MQRIRLGVSSCLLGQKVRYDGGHKRDAFLADALTPFVEWVPLCPEIGIGLPSPRPALRLVSRAGHVHLETREGTSDLTSEMRDWSVTAVRRIAEADLDGYVLKKDSPSCGLERVRLYSEGGMPTRDGQGVFAAELIAVLPHLPVEEEGRLKDPVLRERFFERVFALRRWRDLAREGPAAAALVAFHSAHKLQLMAHSPEMLRRLGRIAASAGDDPRAAGAAYGALFPVALAHPTARGRHVNVLQHALGYFKRLLGDEARQDLGDAVEAYRAGTVPLVVPASLLAHRARADDVTYITHQTYLDPYPAELGLRNAI